MPTGRGFSRRSPDWMPENSRICSTMSVRRRPSPRTSSPYLRTCRLVVDDAVGEVLGGGSDDRERRAELVRDRRDEFHLLLREPLRAAGRQEQQRPCWRRARRGCWSSRAGCGAAATRPPPRASRTGARGSAASSVAWRRPAAVAVQRGPQRRRAGRRPCGSRWITIDNGPRVSTSPA